LILDFFIGEGAPIYGAFPPVTLKDELFLENCLAVAPGFYALAGGISKN